MNPQNLSFQYRSKRRFLAHFHLAFIALLAVCSSAGAANYYVDPVNGSKSNPGTSAQPWLTLESIFSPSVTHTFVAGDVIYLRTGYHGNPRITNQLITGGTATVMPDTGASPTLGTLSFYNASNWIINGLDICPENSGPGNWSTSDLVYIPADDSNNITIENCHIRGAFAITGWSESDWETRLGSSKALNSYGTYVNFLNNTIENVAFGFGLNGPNMVVTGNTVTNFYMDGADCTASYVTFTYNTIKNSYVADANHDDLFQAWSLGTDGLAGTGTLSGITVSNNIFICQTDPNQPLPTDTQGIGCYDGMCVNWVVENNLICTQEGREFFSVRI